jgi:hypothetical protein
MRTGVSVMVVSVPLNTLVARYLKQMQEKRAWMRIAHTGANADGGRAVMKNRDARTRLMSELLANIRSIKLHAWEPAFMRRILAVRNDKELVMLRKYGLATVRALAPVYAWPRLTRAGAQHDALERDPAHRRVQLFRGRVHRAHEAAHERRHLPRARAVQPALVPARDGRERHREHRRCATPAARVVADGPDGCAAESIVSVRRIGDLLAAEELQEDARVVNEKPLQLGDEVRLLRRSLRQFMADHGFRRRSSSRAASSAGTMTPGRRRLRASTSRCTRAS